MEDAQNGFSPHERACEKCSMHPRPVPAKLLFQELFYGSRNDSVYDRI